MTLTPSDLLRPPPNVSIGDRARIARREMGLSQADFVVLLREYLPDLNEKTYASWEAGRTPEDVVRVSEALDAATRYSWAWFLRGVIGAYQTSRKTQKWGALLIDAQNRFSPTPAKVLEEAA